MAIGKEQFYSAGQEDALLHRESLFVITASNAEDVAFKFVAKQISRDLLRDFLVVEDAAKEMKQSESEARMHTRIVHTFGAHRRCRWSFVPQLRDLYVRVKAISNQ